MLYKETTITNAKVLNFIVKSKNVKMELLVDRCKIPYVIIFEKFKRMPLFKQGQQIQVRVSRSPGLVVLPTFFDSKQRCKKCGRFYKVYCKHCYKRSKTLRAILDVFGEVLNVTDFKKIR
ncbi:MAG: hypothetical protein KAW92_10430 [Candidatus Cloacimonetes bacterium]|nr:hypothetical protein [Candidatus Cloacimonadota bacterium]